MSTVSSLRWPHLIGIVMSALLLSSAPSQAGEPSPISTCNFEGTGDHYLTADLDCGGVGGGIVLQGRGARLELRGFTIRGAIGPAVNCMRTCSIIGPGTLRENGIGVAGRASVRVFNLDIQDNEYGGIDARTYRARGRVLVEDSSVTGNSTGIAAGDRVTLVNTTITDNREQGLEVGSSWWRGRNFRDILCGRGMAVLRGSTVANNLLAPGIGRCEPERPCADIQSCRQPTVDEGSFCGSSVHVLPGEFTENWSVCAQD